VLEINYYEEWSIGIIVGALFLLWLAEVYSTPNNDTTDNESRDWGNNEEED
jgi:hypothetical protein